jgi:hypothetical protein
MRLTPLQASTRLPSAVGIMLRTTPPPEGIGQVRESDISAAAEFNA